MTWVAGLVHVEKVAVELDPQVSPQGIQRAQRVEPHPLGATRVEPNEGGALELKPTDHLEHARIGTLTPGRLLRRPMLLPIPIQDVPLDHRRKVSTDEDALEVSGIHVDIGRLDASEVIRPVHSVVVEESATDHMPVVDDGAVDLEYDQQSVCRVGGAYAGVVPGQRQHPVPIFAHRRTPYRSILNET